MSETDDFAHVQRRLCAVIAKSEWTSSRMRMQKSGDELRERRAKTHRTANQFLQDLYEKRSDADLIDDHGALDRYHKFAKHKSHLNDQNSSTLDDFERRLRGLNKQRLETSKKLNQTQMDSTTYDNATDFNGSVYDVLTENVVEERRKERMDESQGYVNVEVNRNDLRFQPKPSRILPLINTIPVTSTPNDTIDEWINPNFHDDENDRTTAEISEVQSISSKTNDNQNESFERLSNIQSFNKTNEDRTESITQLSNVQSINKNNENRTEPKKQLPSSPFERLSNVQSIERLPSSPLERISNGQSMTPILCKPRARRADGTEFIPIVDSPSSPLPKMSTKVLPWNHCSFPRSLTSRTNSKINNAVSKRQLPSLPMGQTMSTEQIDKNQLYQFLDRLESKNEENFLHILDKLTVSPLSTHLPIDQDISMENLSSIDVENEFDSCEMILPEFFDRDNVSTQEKCFYNIVNISLNDRVDFSLYTMTFSTVQLSSSICLPYSLLNGRRPSLKLSKQTNFKSVRSKRKNLNSQITAIESATNFDTLKQNDIVLKINDQSVWRLTTDAIVDLLKQHRRRSNICSLTIARLCQPFV